MTTVTSSSSPEVERVEVFFDSGDARCAAFLYRPVAADGPVPCVVMGHGFSGTRDLGMSAYAERFAAAGMAALVFDYRHFGASGGRPRQLIDLGRQRDDFRAAVRFARGLEGVDAERIALWGTSLGGGHVLAVAATDPRIAAVVAQVPFVGVELGRSSPRSRGTTFGLFAAAARDVLRGLLGRPPFLIRVVGGDAAPAAFTDPEAEAVLDALAAEAPSWRNAVAARVLFSLLLYRPGVAAKRLRMPLLVCIAEQDTAGSVRLAAQAARQAPHGELRRYAAGHWDVYRGHTLEQVAVDQVDFLRDHLLGPAGRTSSDDRSHGQREGDATAAKANAVPMSALSTQADLERRIHAYRRTHPERAVMVNGVRWRYVTGGRGPRTILLPSGGTRVPDLYLLLFEALEPDARVIAPAYPAVPTMAALVDGLAAVLDAEGIGQADVIGSSFGGFVAQCFVRRYPARVRRLVLANTGPPGGTPLPGLALMVRLFRILPEGVVRRATAWNWRRWFVAPPAERRFWHGLLDEVLATRLTKADLVCALEEMLDFARHCRFSPNDLAGWPGRILILESEQDRAFSPAARAELRALYPRARVRTFGSAGHAVMMTHPAEYLAALRDFLAAP